MTFWQPAGLSFAYKSYAAREYDYGLIFAAFSVPLPVQILLVGVTAQHRYHC